MYNFSPSFTEFIELNKNEDQSEFFTKVINSFKQQFDYHLFKSIIKDNIQDIQLEAIDWLISYANFILSDGIITEIELQDFTFLKKIFSIKEGDFMKYKSFEVSEILKKEFIRIYSDNYVNDKEKLLNINLQALFNLGYDEFEELKKDEIIISLIQGANPKNLDITKLPKGFIVI
ncbi:hypothetical protein [Empedobacter tilapiae]